MQYDQDSSREHHIIPMHGAMYVCMWINIMDDVTHDEVAGFVNI